MHEDGLINYRTPFPAMLATSLEVAINHLLSMDEGSSARLAQLDGKLLRLELDGVGINLNFAFSSQRVAISLESGDEADTVVRGTPAALFAMAIPDGEGNWGTAGSRVQISGDATLARDLERLFSRLDPNWEKQIAKWFGDVWGYQVASGVRGAAGQARQTMSDLEGMTADFLNRKGSPLAQQEEITDYGQSVDALRDATERLEARLRIIRQRKAEQSDSTEDEEC
jgi:ubiquinone biosynthesis protein UbiJ